MSSQHLPLSLLLRILPRTAELAGLRQAMLARSTADPHDEWSGSRAYATLDRRVLTDDALESIFAEAEARSIEHVRTYHRLLRDALREAAAADGDGALARLRDLGEAAAGEGRWETCISYYGAVAAIAAELQDVQLLNLAQRRMGRAHLHLGHPQRAARWYAQSLQTAHEIDDTEAVITAHTGLGHTLALEGRWEEAEREYLKSHAACGLTFPRMRAQAAINLSMTAREQQRLDDARRWLDDARTQWDSFEPFERSVWNNNSGLLALALGRHVDAQRAFEAALADSPSHHDTAMILDNLAELCLRTGDVDRAEAHARSAEDYAIAGASARALADIYIRLGRIMRARRDIHGIAFLEKAIQISQENGYTLTEANACTEYALFRTMLGDTDEARGLRERAELLLARVSEREALRDW